MSNKVAVVILNWNGKSFLEKFLPSVIRYSNDAEIVVADNCSTDDSIQFIKENFPSVSIITLDKNYGFTGGYNRALKQVNNKYYVLLNSDVEVTENWLTPMVNLLENDESIAACQPKIKDFNRRTYFEYAGAAGGFIDNLGYPFCQGRIFDTLEEDHQQFEEPKEIFWASGASLFIRSDLYHQHNGLDEFFFAHLEEIDLCWRLQNDGYKIMYCPDSEVFHVGGGTLNKSNPKKTFLNYRNSLLMLHKNLPKNKRFGIIFKRLCLDGVSGFKLLITGQFSHTFAIIKSHFSFYGSLKQNSKKRNSKVDKTPDTMINKSIVYHYFIKNHKTFTSIVK